MPSYGLGLFYLSPFSWVVRSLVLNEFNSSPYDAAIAGPGSPRKGTYYLDLCEETPCLPRHLQKYTCYVFVPTPPAVGFQSSDGWMYGGVVILGVGYYLLFGLVLTAYTLWLTRHRASVGTKRLLDDENAATGVTRRGHGDASSPVATPAAVSRGVSLVNGDSATAIELSPVKSARSLPAPSSPAAPAALPFTPATLAFNDVNYDVVLPDKTTRRLLRGVTGTARPGTMTALMGASGAGA